MSISITLEPGQKYQTICVMLVGQPKSALFFDIPNYPSVRELSEKYTKKRERTLTALEAELAAALENNQPDQADHIKNNITSKADKSDGEKLIDTIKDFLTISMPREDDQNRLYDFYAAAHRTIWELTSANTVEIARKLRSLVRGVFHDLDLPAKAKHFVVSASLPLPTFENTGWRDHDTPEMTFNREEVKEITAVTIIAKLFCPIWGAYAEALKCIGIESVHTDSYNLSIFEPAIEDSIFKSVFKKFYKYSTVGINKVLNEDAYHVSRGSDKKTNFANNMFIISENRYGLEQFYMLMFGAVIVRKAVVYDIWKSSLQGEDCDPQFMVTASSHLKAHAAYTLTRMNDNATKAPRYELDSGSSGLNEENNVTHMENMSSVSKIPMDIPVIQRQAFKATIARLVDEQGFNRNLFDRTVVYYQRNIITPNMFNIAIISVVTVGPILGISRNIDFFDEHELFSLACVYTIFVLLSKNTTEYDPIISMLVARTHRDHTTNPTCLIATVARKHAVTNPNYPKVLKNFPLACLEVDRTKRSRRIKERQTVSRQLARLVEWLTSNDHYSHLYSALAGKIEPQYRTPSGELIVYVDNFMERVYALFLEFCPNPRVKL